jgi:hypothetical protein
MTEPSNPATVADFPRPVLSESELWLRSATPEVRQIVEQLKAGTVEAPNLPLDRTSGEALQFWRLLVKDGRAEAADIRAGRRRRARLIGEWAESTRIRYGVQDAYLRSE